MHFPFQAEFPQIAEIMRGIGLRMLRPEAIQQLQQMRAVEITVALGGILWLFEGHKKGLPQTFQRRERARVKLIGQRIP